MRSQLLEELSLQNQPISIDQFGKMSVIDLSVTAYKTVQIVYLVSKLVRDEYPLFYSRTLKKWILPDNDGFISPSCYFAEAREAIEYRNLWLKPIETLNTSIVVRNYKVDLQKIALYSKLIG